MAEYVTKEQVIEWYRPYGQTDEHIPFETLVSDLRDMKTADVAPVRHGRWKPYHEADIGYDEYGVRCSNCKFEVEDHEVNFIMKYCPNCGADMRGSNDE